MFETGMIKICLDNLNVNVTSNVFSTEKTSNGNVGQNKNIDNNKIECREAKEELGIDIKETSLVFGLYCASTIKSVKD